MKSVQLLLAFFLIVLITSCSYSKKYSSCENIGKALKDEHYKDLIKDWGDPYQKDYYGPNNEWLCKWHGVGVNGTDAVIHFENITYDWGEHAPFTVRGVDCTPTSNPSSTNNNENINLIPVTHDEPEVVNKPDTFQEKKLEVVKPNTDSIGLINISKFNTVYRISNKLPLSYYTGNLKFTFRKDTVLKVDCYDGDELYKTFICKQERGDIIPMGCDKYFAYREGELFLVNSDNHNSTQLAIVR